MVKGGVTTVAQRRVSIEKSATALRLHFISWFEHWKQGRGNRMPDADEFHLAPGLKIKDIQSAYNEDLKDDCSLCHRNGEIGKSTVYSMMATEFPKVKKRKWVRFTKCGKCTYLDDLLKNPDLTAPQRGMSRFINLPKCLMLILLSFF